MLASFWGYFINNINQRTTHWRESHRTGHAENHTVNLWLLTFFCHRCLVTTIEWLWLLPEYQVLFQKVPAYGTTNKCLHIQTNFDKYPNDPTCQTRRRFFGTTILYGPYFSCWKQSKKHLEAYKMSQGHCSSYFYVY